MVDYPQNLYPPSGEREDPSSKMERTRILQKIGDLVLTARGKTAIVEILQDLAAEITRTAPTEKR